MNATLRVSVFPRACLTLWLLFTGTPYAWSGDGNRLSYLQGNDPYYVSWTFPKLITPQWVGEEGVDAVVILAIDDMRGHERWETYLRPVLERLKRIDGRAPVSIMTCQIEPRQPHLQKWLREGLSLETHTIDHPCPLLRDGDFAKAKSTYDRCVDLLAAVPNNRPVAFRTPCCDSLNTVSPRFHAEIFNRTTAAGRFLAIDSSVFHLFTPNDPALPRSLVLDGDGQERFRKYQPRDRTFVNYIEDYPYPYVIGRLCWQFPCMTPSDWQSQHHFQPGNPITLRDWQAALDATVIKQGVFNVVFHPYGWITNDQVVAFIDYAVTKYGRRVKFVTFREALDRLNENLLGGQPLRAANGQDNGVRLLDLNGDGYLDVLVGNEQMRQTRLWDPTSRRWMTTDLRTSLVMVDGDGNRLDAGACFGIVRPSRSISMLMRNGRSAGAWHFSGNRWVEDQGLLAGFEANDRPVLTNEAGRDRGVRLHDLDHDGCCELLIANTQQNAVLAWSEQDRRWRPLSFRLPDGMTFVDSDGRDAGLRLVDVDEDGFVDVFFADRKTCRLYLFNDMQRGWDRPITLPADFQRPVVSRDGQNNGAWFSQRSLIIQNEDTNRSKDLIARIPFNDLLRDVEPRPKSPEASLACIRVRPGFRVELVASEPLLHSPVAFAWGADGKLWVVEMGDYPGGADGKGQPGGRIKFLEDTDSDGQYDKATVFLDGLAFPTSVLPWGRGVLVTCAPDLFYAEDADGDGKADRRDVLYTGFTRGNPQHLVNGLIYGLDNWVYCANGDSGGEVRSIKTGKMLNIRGRDFRIRPADGGLELQAGQTQYGRCRDDWGNWFGGNNSFPMWHYALDDHYLRRNPHVAAPVPRVGVSGHSGPARVYPISRLLPRFNDPHTANHFTSACSPTVYRDEWFGPSFAINTFVCEPVHNLIHREIMTPRGVTFTSRAALDESRQEFLASSDNWFRPVFAQTGPDGALWVADMYRHVIEHPEWIPADWQKRLDLRAGHDKGRIYRIVPVDQRPRPIARLDRLDAAQLVAALDHPNGWQRDTAQRLLIERADETVVTRLQEMAQYCPRPLARLHALCTLDGLQRLSLALLLHAMNDQHAGVRRHAARLSEARLTTSPALGQALLESCADPDPQVRMQVAYTLGAWNDPRAGTALGQLLVHDGTDPYLRAAALSSLRRENLDATVRTVLAAPAEQRSLLLDSLLRTTDGLNDPPAERLLVDAITAPRETDYAPWQFAALADWFDLRDRRNTSGAGTADRWNDPRVQELLRAARCLASSASAAPAARAQAVRVVARGTTLEDDLNLLAGLLTPQTPDEVQVAVITRVGRLRYPSVAARLLDGWKSYSPALRGHVLDVLLQRSEGVGAVLTALEQKQIAAAELDATRRQRLLGVADKALQQRAARLFGGARDADRQRVIDDYRKSFALKADAARGAILFHRHCAGCHRHDNVGHPVGPDIASVGDKTPTGLLTAILDPNRAVEARYLNYVAVTEEGQTVTGVIASETSTGVTLVGQDGKTQTVLRKSLEALSSTGKSLMPDGLEKDLSAQEMTDLIAYLRGPPVGTTKRKSFDGNRPEVVLVSGDRFLWLLPANAEIYGTTLVLEKQYGNLGYWSSADDHAAWTVEVPRSGKYAVSMSWACAPESAGNTFVLEYGANHLTGHVASTGSWDSYRQSKVGEIDLSAGRQRLTMRPAGQLRGALIDLKYLKLTPVP